MVSCNIQLFVLCLLSISFSVVGLEFVGISGKDLLNKTSRGKKIHQAIDQEADKLVKNLDEGKAIVVKAEQDVMNLQKQIQQLAQKYQSEGMTDEQDAELNKLIDQYEFDTQELQRVQQELEARAEKYKNHLRTKKTESLSSFDQDVIQRHAPLQGWDIVFSQDQPSVLYVSKKLHKTDQLVKALDKQMATKDKVYATKEEVKQLFKDLGIVYLDKIKIDSSVTGDLNGFYTDHFEKNRIALHKDRQFASHVLQEYRAPICVKWVNDKVGFGVFATADIKAGSFVQEYTGVLQEVASKRGVAFDGSYAWNYPAVAHYAEGALTLDAKYEGNEMRFVNHSNHPNTQQLKVIDDNGIYHACYVATQDIKAGEQITVSYGMGYWMTRDFFEDL